MTRARAQRCDACGAWRVAASSSCLRCGSTTFTEADLASTGTVHAATVIRIPLPGHSAPMALAYVDIAPGPRVLGPVDRAVAVGETVAVEPADTSPSGVRFRAASR